MPLAIKSISYQTHQSHFVHCGATSKAVRGVGDVTCLSERASDGWRLVQSGRTEQTGRLRSWNLIFSVALRVEHAQCWCLSSLPLWDATAVLPSRLGTGLLVDISLMERYSGQAAAARKMLPSAFLCFAVLLRPPTPSYLTCLSIQPPSLFLPLYFSHIISYFLTSILSAFALSWSLILSPPLHIPLSHTLVATFKTAVAMVTAMCCRNVKELNPHRITSLF